MRDLFSLIRVQAINDTHNLYIVKDNETKEEFASLRNFLSKTRVSQKKIESFQADFTAETRPDIVDWLKETHSHEFHVIFPTKEDEGEVYPLELLQREFGTFTRRSLPPRKVDYTSSEEAQKTQKTQKPEKPEILQKRKECDCVRLDAKDFSKMLLSVEWNVRLPKKRRRELEENYIAENKEQWKHDWFKRLKESFMKDF